MRKDIQGINAAWAQVIRESNEEESQDLYMLKYSLANGLEVPTFTKLAQRALIAAGHERADVEEMDTLELIARIEELTDMELATDGRTVGID